MADLSLPARDSVAAQREMFRLAQAEHGLSIAALAKRSPISASTLTGWKNGAAMSAWAIGELGAAGVPDHLLSLLTEPWLRSVVTDPEGEPDLDSAAEAALAFGSEVQKARSPKSPGGLAIVPQEKVLIEPKRRKACAAMRCAA